MKKKIVLEALSPLICGGIRIADNFFESEQFIRGSVLRAAFANRILLECPLADVPGGGGQLNFVEEKDPEGICENCPKKEICRRFSEMTFSFAYPDGAVPAPFTTMVCKDHGTAHPREPFRQRDRHRFLPGQFPGTARGPYAVPEGKIYGRPAFAFADPGEPYGRGTP